MACFCILRRAFDAESRDLPVQTIPGVQNPQIYIFSLIFYQNSRSTALGGAYVSQYDPLPQICGDRQLAGAVACVLRSQLFQNVELSSRAICRFACRLVFFQDHNFGKSISLRFVLVQCINIIGGLSLTVSKTDSRSGVALTKAETCVRGERCYLAV